MAEQRPLTIALVAGETSGDIQALVSSARLKHASRMRALSAWRGR